MGDRVIISHGRPVATPAEAVTGDPITESELDALEHERDQEKLYGGAAGAITAGALGVASGFTGGLSDLALRAAGGGEALREFDKRHKPASIGGQIGGTVVGLPGKLAGKLAGSVEGAGVGAAVKRGALEGGVYGAQQGLHELGLDDQPLTAERAVSVLGLNTLMGVGLGAAGSGAARAAQLGLKRGGRLLQSVAKRAEAGETAGGLVDEIAAHHQAVETEGVWLAVDNPSERNVLRKASRSIRDELDDPVGLAAAPQRVIKPARRQVEVFKKALEDSPAILKKIAEEEVEIAQKLRARVADASDTIIEGTAAPKPLSLTGKTARRYADWSRQTLKKGGKLLVSPDDASAFADAIESGQAAGMRAQGVAQLPVAIERAQALVDRIEIEREALKQSALTAGKKPYVQRLAERVGPVVGWGMLGHAAGGPAGALGAVVMSDVIGKAAGFVGERLARAVGASTKSTGKAVGALLGGEAVESVTPHVRGFLSGRKVGAAVVGGLSLANAYRQRAEEIRSHTMMGPDGEPMMRPESRAALGRALAPIAAGNPMLADRMETIAAKKIEFLSKKLPRRPDIAAMSAGGPDAWQEGEPEMRAWGRLAWAADHPDGVESLLASGSITPEDAEAYREIYPQRYRDLQLTIAMRLPELRKKLPYRQRLALSIFTGNPVDPSLDPAICRVLQSNFEMEEGTEGGTKPAAVGSKFGSVEVESPTPAQKRAG